MKDRIRQLMDYEGLNAAQFSKKVNINTSVLSHLLVGRNNPSYDIVLKILENCPEVNVEWFMRGIGPMLKDGTSPSLPYNTSEPARVNPAVQPGLIMTDKSQVEDFPDLFSNPVPKPPIPTPKTPEIPKSRADVRTTAEYRRENAPTPPEIPAKPIETVVDKLPVSPARKISKIVVFYSDNSYEEFVSAN